MYSSTMVHHTEGKSSATNETPPQQPAMVDLTTCESVSYEMRDRVPGVKYMVVEAWTPVVKQSCRKNHCPDDSYQLL